LLEVPPDQLKVRLDFYNSVVLAHIITEQGVVETRVVSARDVAMALVGEVNMISGLLPRNTLCWSPTETALWMDPQVWQVALMTEPFKPPHRLQIPMPGLIFICRSAQPPRVYAAKRRPKNMGAILYHAPLFNIYRDGRTCPGSHQYPNRIEEIPKSFFTAFFTPAAEHTGRSKKYPNALMKLWQELHGKRKYPLQDLVVMGRLEEIFGKFRVGYVPPVPDDRLITVDENEE